MKNNKFRILVFSLLIFVAALGFADDKEGVFGQYRLTLHEASGTFTLSMIDSSGEKFIPVFNPLDYSSGTVFYLKAGSKIYPLSKRAGVPVVQKMTETGAVITYRIKKVAEVSFNFSFRSSEKGGFVEDSDLVVMDILIKNIGKKSRIFSLRGVLDTYLGENNNPHFSTKTIPSLNTEALFNSMFADKWIKSSDGLNSIKILLDGDSITRPSSAAVANRDILSVDTWEPRIVPGRGFNSLFSLNNSAIGVTWNSYKVGPEKLCGIRFYISCATHGEEAADTSSNYFVSGKAAKDSAMVSGTKNLVAEEVVEYVVLTTDEKDDADSYKTKEEKLSDEKAREKENSKEVKSSSDKKDDKKTSSAKEPAKEPVKEPVKEQEKEPVKEIKPEEKTSQKFEQEEEASPVDLPDVDITPEKLKPEYVAAIIQQIEELEKNPDLYDVEKVLYLHAELDAILKILGQ